MRASYVLAAAFYVLAAGCGGAEVSEEPRLPRAVGTELARSADLVAEALDRGDQCGAAERAAALQQQAINAVNGGDVPPALQEEFLAGVNRLASSVECVPPAPAPPPPPQPPPPAADPDEVEGEQDEHEDGAQGRGRGQDRGKGKDKDKRHGDGD